MARWTSLAIVVLVAAGCGSDSPASVEATPSSPEQPATTATVAPAASPPAFASGEPLVGEVALGEVTIEYAAVAPAGFATGDTAPVLLALPPGGQDLELTSSLVTATYGPEASERGWVVVSPAAPGGTLFFEGSEAHVPALLDWIETWVAPEGGAVHVAGVSNGGISAFRIAAENPGRIRSLVAFPGFPRSDADRGALSELAAIPVRMFVGERDESWIEPMEATARTLTEHGGDVNLEIVPGEGHVIAALRDGVRLFDELDALRSGGAGNADGSVADDSEQLFPDVIDVVAEAEDTGTFRFDVTISSPYDTQERYADAWRVVGPDGTVYGVRELTHDHAAEQPFTRSLGGVEIPDGVTTVTIEGRDLANGWGGRTFELTLPSG